MKKIKHLLYIFILVFMGLKASSSPAQTDVTSSKLGVLYVRSNSAMGDLTSNDSEGIQKAINALPKSGGRLIIPPGLYIIDTILSIANRQNITLSLSNEAVLISKKHGHGILEISNCKNIKIEGGKFSGRGDFLDKNYKDSDGGGEKVYTLREKLNWGHYRNSELKKLGAYNDGFIGNSGIGILVYNGSEDILITNVEVEKFNYSGIQVQFLGHAAKIQENYCKNITIENNVIHNIYSAGISVHGLSESKILNNTIYDIGHPDTNGEELQVNPGYGITMRGVSKDGAHANNITVAYNGIRNCKRVGIDSHSGNNLNFHDNTIDKAFIAGISIVGKSGKRDNVTLSKNIINNCGNVSGGEGIEAKTGIRNIYPNTIIEKNIIKNSGYDFGIYSRGSNTTIKENTVLYYHNTNKLYTRGICVVGSEDGYLTGNEILGNTIQGDIETSIYIDYLRDSSVMNNISKENNSIDPFKIKNSKVKKKKNKSL